MKPIVGTTTYPDLSHEEIERYVREAHQMRSEYVHALLKGLWRAVIGAVVGTKGDAAPGVDIHPAAGAR